MENKNVPSIRFKGFFDDWEQRKLGELAEFNPKSKLPEKFEYVDLESVVGTALIGHKTESIESAPSRAQRLAAYGDVFYQTVRPYQKNNYLYDLPYDNFVFSTGYAQMRPKNSGYFLLNLVQEEKFVNRVLERSTGTSYPAINSNDLSRLSVKVSVEKKEQTKIGTFFKQLDETITLQERELELLKLTKKGFLQQLFPENNQLFPNIRFSNFQNEWEQRKLGDISEKVTLKNKDNRFDETLTNSAEFGIISQNEFFDKEISNRSNLDGYYVVKNNNFVYNPRISNFAPVGPVKRNKLGRTGVMSPLYYVFKTRNIDNDFLEKYFDTTYWHIFMKLNGDSGARADRFAIKDSVFKEMPIPFPKLEEQTKIGNFFKQLDETITLQEEKLKKLKETKKSFLQKMFI